MKFGRQLHRHVVPEWDRYYVDYNGIKQRIKSSISSSNQPDVTAAYHRIDQNVDSLESFRRSRNDSLLEALDKVRVRFGLPSERVDNQILNNIDHAELLVILHACLDLQRDIAKLQWFDRLNREAIERLFSKLERIGLRGNTVHSRCRARCLTLQNTLDSALAKILDNLETLAALVRGIITSTKSNAASSLFLNRAFNQHNIKPAFRDALTLALKENGETIIEVFDTMRREQEVSATSFQYLLRDVLEYSLIIHPTQLASSLLSSGMVQESSVIDHELLELLIIATGQKTLAGDNASDSNVHLLTRILDCLGAGVIEVLLAKDGTGRCPLHYAAKYGLANVCQVIMKILAKSRDSSVLKQAVLSLDNENQTALHYAVVGNNLEMVEMFLDRLCVNTNDHEIRSSLGDVLIAALRCQNDGIISLLINCDANLSYLTTRGETPLHIAAQFGRHDYIEKLLPVMSKQGAEIDVPEFSRGWTPLFTACASGSLEIVKMLLEAGASQKSKDYLGWTAKEHAAFRGHLPIAELFQAYNSDDLKGGPADSLKRWNMNAQIHVGPRQKIIFVGLGSAQGGKDVSAVDLDFCSSRRTGNIYQTTSYVLEILAPGTSLSPMRVPLPVLDEKINDPFEFRLEEHAQLQLVLKVFQTCLSAQLGERLVAIGTAVLDENSRRLGAQRQNMIEECAVAMLDQDEMRIAGCVTLTYLIARAYPYLQTPRFADLNIICGGDLPLLVGHRGLGQNTASREYLQIGENTVKSALAATKVGATYVEFDVQVTRDLEPVIFHDFSLSETGTDIPIHDVTLEQFKYASDIQSPHGNPVSVLERAGYHHTNDPRARLRSRSVGGNFEGGAIQIQDRMKHTVDFKDKGFKPNTRGSFIQDSLATLEELLKEVPEELGFDLEIKYPRLHEARGASMAAVATEMNTFIDVILDKLHRFGGNRRIVLSSFTPDICILLSIKQHAYPVMFITNAGKVPLSDMEVRAASVQVAVHFARRWKLAGVVFASEPLLLCPRLAQFVINSGLLCASYGPLNNVPLNAKRQAEAGVSILVADRIGLIAKALAEDRYIPGRHCMGPQMALN